jgi:Phospholipid methyltransferase
MYRTIRLFARAGQGTLAPWDPTRRLVIQGPYRYLRNPMISGVLAVLIGEAVLLGSPPLAAWFAVFLAANAALVSPGRGAGAAPTLRARVRHLRPRGAGLDPPPHALEPAHPLISSGSGPQCPGQAEVREDARVGETGDGRHTVALESEHHQAVGPCDG